MTKTQVDRLGERLRQGVIGEAELRALAEHRRSFSAAHDEVVQLLRSRYELAPTKRSKTNLSILDKLRREPSIRLSQIQDIAGCRIVTNGIGDQEEVISQVRSAFSKVTIDDRRERPSNGYRAVHLIVEHSGKLIEIQVRTGLQHLWAEVSEKFADLIDPAVKYGGGPPDVRASLDGSSGEIRELEFLDLQIMASKAGTGLVWPPEDPMLERLESRLKARTIEWSNLFRGIIVKLDNLR